MFISAVTTKLSFTWNGALCIWRVIVYFMNKELPADHGTLCHASVITKTLKNEFEDRVLEDLSYFLTEQPTPEKVARLICKEIFLTSCQVDIWVTDDHLVSYEYAEDDE